MFALQLNSPRKEKPLNVKETFEKKHIHIIKGEKVKELLFNIQNKQKLFIKWNGLLKLFQGNI